MTATPPIERLAGQKTLFASRLNRFALMKLQTAAPSDAPALRVHRNHAFESVASALPPFMAFAGVALAPVLGDYDDSLRLPDGEAACELVWLDFARYERLGDAALADWLTGRLDALRAASSAPVVVANAPGDAPRDRAVNSALAAWAQRTPDAAVLELDRIAARPDLAFLDEARAAVTGSRYSDSAALETARTLAFEVLPRFFQAPIKAIAVDLDNTLYAGVLGEDGVAGVDLTPGHAALQARLADWAAKGLLLAVISRNEAADVASLFAARADFPLRAEHVSDWQVGWGAKSDAIAAAAARFNIAADSILFVDDNAGELLEAAQASPGLRLLHADVSAAETAQALDRYPGLPRAGGAFAGRAADIRANSERQTLAANARSDRDYLRDLRAELTFSLDPAADLQRLAEISGKTNQFNLSLKRLSETEVARYLADRDRRVVHIRLADRLADSGSVAALFVRREADVAVVDELCISCRALGRKLEDLMVAEALRRAARELGCAEVAFEYVEGPRNAPARRWLEEAAGRPLQRGHGRLSLQRPPELPGDAPVTLRWTD